jgi:hypothetical protein
LRAAVVLGVAYFGAVDVFERDKRNISVKENKLFQRLSGKGSKLSLVMKAAHLHNKIQNFSVTKY